MCRKSAQGCQSQPHSTCSESPGLEMTLGLCWMQGALKSHAYSESVWNYTPSLRKSDDPSGATHLGMTHQGVRETG